MALSFGAACVQHVELVSATVPGLSPFSKAPDLRVEARVITTAADWLAIRLDWDALFGASVTASTALDFTWLYEWWRVYRSSFRTAELRVVTVWRGARLLGALPLYVRQELGGPIGLRCLAFISTGEAEFEETCADYLNMLCIPGEEVNCADSMWRAIELMKWDHLQLLDIPKDSPLVEARRASAGAGAIDRGKCPIAELSGGFNAYVEKLSQKARQQVRYCLREVEKHRPIFEIASPSNQDEFFGDLVKLHQERWTAEGKPGCFSAKRFTEFHAILARTWVPERRAILARLSHRNQVYAVLYGFVTRSKFDLYQLGVRRTGAGSFHSPGVVANILLMRALVEEGVTAYDFLRGASTHKERLATHDAELVALEAWRPTLASALYRSADIAGRAARKGWRLMAGDS